MSRTPVQPHPEVARATGVMLFGGILTAQALALPRGFQLGGYLGVIMITTCLLAWAGAVGLLAGDRSPAWWYALADGGLTILAWLLTQLFGLPVTEAPVAGRWLDPTGLLLLFFSSNLVLLSIWVLRVRQVTAAPVTSAEDRARRQTRQGT